MSLVWLENFGSGTFTESTQVSPSRASSPVSATFSFFAMPDLGGIGVHGARQRRAEAGEMGAAVALRNVVGEAEHVLVVDAAVRAAGRMASGCGGLMHAVPVHARARTVDIPEDGLLRHGTSPAQLLAGEESEGLTELLADLRETARAALRSARQYVAELRLRRGRPSCRWLWSILILSLARR